MLQCQPELAELFWSLRGVERVMLPMEPLPRYDAQCSLMSLPLALGTERDTIPAEVPYLHVAPERFDCADEDATAQSLLGNFIGHDGFPPSPGTPGEGRGEGLVELQSTRKTSEDPHSNPLPGYRERGSEGTTSVSFSVGDLQPLRAPLRVGLSWAGNSMHHNDRYRSIALAQLEPLLHVPGDVKFYAIQKGPAIAQALQPFEGRFTDLGETMRTFAQTAARLAALDLLISVDTAVAHLAGALGRPV